MPKKGKSLAPGRKSRYAQKSKRSKKSKGMSRNAIPNQYTPYTFLYRTLPNVMANMITSVVIPGTAPPQYPAPGDHGIQFRSIGLGAQSSNSPFSGYSMNGSVTGHTASFTQILPSASGFDNYYDVGLATSFKLSDLSQEALLADQFDQYRINKVDCVMEYLSNSAFVNGVGMLPTVYIYNDIDSALPPVALRNVVGAAGVRQKLLADKQRIVIKHSCVPRILIDSEAAPSVAGKPGQWIDCSERDIDHFAMKFYFTDLFLPPANSAQTTCVKFTFKYHVQYRGPLSCF